VLAPARRAALVDELALERPRRRAVYDALIAVTASGHGHELATCDRRATVTYERVGASFTLLV
jgi:predicted nucleic acid-binding protein